MLILKAAKAHIRAENERLILEAGERIFAQHGFRGATMQMIADQAGLPKANLHYYFDSKEKLYRCVVEKIFEIWLQAASSFENSDEPKEALNSIFMKRCKSAAGILMDQKSGPMR